MPRDYVQSGRSVCGRSASPAVTGRRGRAALFVLLTLGLFVGGISLLVFGADDAPAPLRPTGPAIVPESVQEAPAFEAARIVTGDHEIEYEKDFQGSGATISGEIEFEGAAELPDAWTLWIRPSRFIEGTSTAIERRSEYAGNERTFVEQDLPLGGYAVSVVAPGWNCPTQNTVLLKIKGRSDLPGKLHSRLLFKLRPAGTLTGSVITHTNEPADGLSVTLIDRASGERIQTSTDPAGRYRFDVIDAQYRLVLGDETRPLLEPHDVNFKGPLMQLDEQQLPETTALTLALLDEFGEGVPEATVRGFGTAPIDAVSDAGGIVYIPYLPQGKYRVRAEHRSGRKGKVDFDLWVDQGPKRVEISMLKKF